MPKPICLQAAMVLTLDARLALAVPTIIVPITSALVAPCFILYSETKIAGLGQATRYEACT